MGHYFLDIQYMQYLTFHGSKFDFTLYELRKLTKNCMFKLNNLFQNFLKVAIS